MNKPKENTPFFKKEVFHIISQAPISDKSSLVKMSRTLIKS